MRCLSASQGTRNILLVRETLDQRKGYVRVREVELYQTSGIIANFAVGQRHRS